MEGNSVKAPNSDVVAGRAASRRRRAWRRGSVLAAAITAAVLGLAACGGGSGGSSNAGGSTHSQQLAFSGCMRSHGVPNYPDPDSSGNTPKKTAQQLGVTDSQFQAAVAACRSREPTRSAAQQREQAAQALRFSVCMRNHGITNFPDPDRTGRIPDPGPVGLDQGSPQFQAANQACGQYRPPYFPSNAAYNAWARANGA